MRKLMLFALLLALGILGSPQAQAYKGKVIIALPGEPPTMDPHRVSNWVGTLVWRWSFDTLLSAETGTGKHVPWLATKWEKLSPTKVKFWLRKGVRFHDGTPFNAEAVKYTMSRVKASPRQSVYFKSFDHIEIIDDHTLIWHSKGPDNGLFNRVTRFAHPISPKVKDMDPAVVSRNSFGTGPYILKSWVKGQQMVFEANPNWWGNEMYPDRPETVVLRRIQEPTTRVKALMTGEVDLIMGVQPQYIPEIEKNPKTTAVSVPAVRILYLTFFTRHGGPLADVNVRKAINYAIDADTIRKTILGGRADLWGQVFHPWNYSGYNPDKKWYGYDQAKAKEYLKKSAYPNGFKVEFFTPTGRYPGDKATCEAAAGMIKEIGIDVVCRPMKYPLWRKTFKAHQQGQKKIAGMSYIGFGNGTGDPALASRGMSSCKGAWSGHCFKDLEAQIDKAASTADPEQQQKEFEKVTDMQKEKALFKIFFKIHDVFGISKRIKFNPRHDETVPVWEIMMK